MSGQRTDVSPARRPVLADGGPVTGREAAQIRDQASTGSPGGRPARPLDAFIGVILAFLGVGNLVQGQWTRAWPFLDITTLGFLATAPLAFFAILASRRRGAGGLTLLLITIVVLGLLNPPLQQVSTEKRLALAYGVLYIWLVSVLLFDRWSRVRWFMGTVVALASTVLAGQLLGRDPLQAALGRITPAGLNPIGVGRLLAVAAVIMLALAITWHGRRRVGAAVLVVLFATGMVSTSSRGPVLGFAVAVMVVIWGSGAIRLGQKVAISCAGLATVMVANWLLELPARIVQLGTTGRDSLYAEAVKVIADHPSGVGWGNFYLYVGRIAAADSLGDNLYAHNLLLEVTAEAGWLAGLGVTAFFAVVLVRAWRARRSEWGMASLGIFICLFAGAMFSSDLVGNRLLWMTAGLIVGVGARSTSTDLAGDSRSEAAWSEKNREPEGPR